MYCKPKNANNYLHYNSSHLRKCKDSIVYSQFIRIRQICSKIQDFNKHCLSKGLHFKRHSSTLKVISEAYKRARANNRSKLISPDVDGGKDTGPDKPKVIAVTHYHPSCCYKRPKNLGEYLIRAKLPKQPSMEPTPVQIHQSDKPACTSKTCRYCPIINQSGRITSHVTVEAMSAGPKCAARAIT